MSKKGKIEIEYVIVFALALLILVIMLIYSGKIKEKAIELVHGFFNIFMGRN